MQFCRLATIRHLGIVTLMAAATISACGDDDDAGPASTSDGSVASTSVASTAGDEVGDDEQAGPAEQRDIPSLEEVGRADFTYTIVAGDFLRSIADRYQVEIDDIVGANEWDDGRDHLLLPGDVIYLPADAEQPPETDATAAEQQSAGAASSTVDPSTVCQGGVMADTYQISEGDTVESVAARLGVSATDLRVANTGVTFGTGGSVWVPCMMNWPRFVAFSVLVDPPVCTDMSIQGTYTVQRSGDSDDIGEGATDIAARLGVTEQQLSTENPNVPFSDLQAGDTIAVCMDWFES
jgi:LysM repeat protein